MQKINTRYNQNTFKNDFNLISNISRNVNFSFKPNKSISNNIPNFFLNEDNYKNLNKEEEKMDMNMKGKSRNYFNTFSDEKYDQKKTNDMVSFSIHADLNKHYNLTQKTFMSMATQLRQKRNIYSSNIKDKSSYRKYYELFKNKKFNNKLLKNLNINRIQYYQKPENENTEKPKDILNKYNINNNTLDFADNSNSILFSNGMNDSNINNRTISTSFFGAKTRASSESKIINYKIRSGMIGYSSTLICPKNIFKSKLD